MATEVTTGAGRLVWGHPNKWEQMRDQNDRKKLLVNDDGTPRMNAACGIAFPKMEFQRDIWPAMAAEAATAYSQGIPPKFSWKFTDGDGVDKDGVPFANREGYAGHVILAVATQAFAPPIYRFNPQTGIYDQMDGEAIYPGCWLSVYLSFSVNVPKVATHTPSLYVNPKGFEFLGFDKRIITATAIDPKAAFGGRQHQLPAGVSQTPVLSGPGIGTVPQLSGPGGPVINMQQQPQQGGYPPQQPQQGGYPPQQPVQPAHDFVQHAGQQPGYQPQQGGYPPQQPRQGGYPPQQPQPGGSPMMPGMQGGYPSR